MLRTHASIDDAVSLLKEMLELDPEATTALLNYRVPCNEALANHPTIQVHDEGGGCSVGLLGVLNGLHGVDDRGYGPIAIEVEDNGAVSDVTRTKG